MYYLIVMFDNSSLIVILIHVNGGLEFVFICIISKYMIFQYHCRNKYINDAVDETK